MEALVCYNSGNKNEGKPIFNKISGGIGRILKTTICRLNLHITRLHVSEVAIIPLSDILPKDFECEELKGQAKYSNTITFVGVGPSDRWAWPGL